VSVIAVTGCRAWPARARAVVEAALDQHAAGAKLLLVGDATGVDRFAFEWALARKIPVRCFRADWHAYGRAAGPIRNRAMLDAGADQVLAFAWMAGPGTKDCAAEARRRGIPGLWIAARPREDV
jgi:hypothetical protein